MRVIPEPVTGDQTHYTREQLLALGIQITPGLQRFLDRHHGVMPRIAGADGSSDDEEAKKKAEAEVKEKAEAEARKKKEEEEAEEDPEVKDEAAKEVLRRERRAKREADKARRDAEKRAEEAEKKVKEREDEEASETDKAKKRAEEAEGKLTSATEKLRRANLLSALAEEGLAGARGKAAARLLDGVEFDSDDEPTNLKDAIAAAKAEYGEEMFKKPDSGKPEDGSKPRGSGNGDGGAGSGPSDEQQYQRLASAFPGLRPKQKQT